MSIKHSLFIICAIFFITSSAFADVFSHEQSINSILPKLPELKNTNCKFTQDKYIPASNLHLKSGGNFSFEKDKGVTFYTTYPIKSTVSYSSSEYKQINNVIKAIANKHYSKLEQNFKFYFEEINGIWTLGLKPKENTKSADYLYTIEVTGKKDISQIVITTFDKTQTTINFFNEKAVNESI